MKFYAVFVLLLLAISVIPWVYHDYKQDKRSDEALISSARELVKANAKLDAIKKDNGSYFPTDFKLELQDFFDRMDKLLQDLDNIFHAPSDDKLENKNAP